MPKNEYTLCIGHDHIFLRGAGLSLSSFPVSFRPSRWRSVQIPDPEVEIPSMSKSLLTRGPLSHFRRKASPVLQPGANHW